MSVVGDEDSVRVCARVCPLALTDSSLPVAQMRRNNQVPFLAHTHLQEPFFHPRDHLVRPEDNVVCLAIIIPGMKKKGRRTDWRECLTLKIKF